MSEQSEALPFWDLERWRAREAGDGPQEGAPADAKPPPAPGERTVTAEFKGDGGVLFAIASGGIVLTTLTLGLYRFWMITRLRRHFWGAIHIDGDPLEYTGRPLEKLLGFLMAVMLLAVYLGIVNIALAFAGLSILSEDPALFELALQISGGAALPFYFYAVYRSWGYRLARTRWRGIRFGLKPGAMGFVLRGLGYSLLTVATLGLAWPYQQFRMERYLVERASFGSLPFRQHGDWRELLWHWLFLYVAAAVAAVCVWGLYENPQDTTAWLLGSLVLTFGGALGWLFYHRYKVAVFRILWSERSLGRTRFDSEADAAKVIWTTLVGNGVTNAITALVAVGLGLGLLAVAGEVIDLERLLAALQTRDWPVLAEYWPLAGVAVSFYLIVISVFFAFQQLLVHRPVLAHKVETMTLANVGALSDSRQGREARAGEAGGFADALGMDVGAGL